jgi:hypothetical protein
MQLGLNTSSDNVSYANDVVLSARSVANSGGRMTSISSWLDERLRNPAAVKPVIGPARTQLGMTNAHIPPRER